MSVAIITRTKNRAILLKRAIESVLTQSYTNWIHVIVNDGGESATVDDLVAQYKDQYHDRLIVIHNPTSIGMEAASNKGIKATDSKYIVIHDDDDSWDKNFLAVTTNYLENAASTEQGVVCQFEVILEKIVNNKVHRILKHGVNRNLQLISLLEMAARNPFPPIAFLYKRQVLNKIGYYDETMPVAGDWDFNLKFLLEYDIGMVMQPLAFYHHRKQDFGSSYSNSVIAGRDLHLKYHTIMLNRILKQSIRSGSLSLATLMLHAKTLEYLLPMHMLFNILRKYRQHYKNFIGYYKAAFHK